MDRRRFRILRRAVGGRLLPVLGPPFIGFLRRTWRAEHHGLERLERAARGQGAFVAIWHGRMLLGLPYYAHRGWWVLVSPSDDGGLVKILLDHYGYGVVRGSSSRGGARAVREMLSVVEREAVIVVTPDGPRGPRHSMNPGLAWMARESGRAIVPVGLACDRAWRLESWDRFTIPKPRARLVLAYGEPVRVAPDAGEEALEHATRTVRERLVEAEEGAFRHLGRGRDL